MVIDFRKARTTHHPPLTMCGKGVERVSSANRFLGVNLADDLSTTTNTMAITKNVQQRLHPLWRLKQACLPISALSTFYWGTTESVLTYCITAWFGSCTAAECTVSSWTGL